MLCKMFGDIRRSSVTEWFKTTKGFYTSFFAISAVHRYTLVLGDHTTTDNANSKGISL